MYGLWTTSRARFVFKRLLLEETVRDRYLCVKTKILDYEKLPETHGAPDDRVVMLII